MAIVSPLRAVGMRESGGRPGSVSSIAAGAGAMDIAAGAGSGAGAWMAAFGFPVESAPGRAGTEPANAGPGVMDTRAGAIVTRGVSAARVAAELVPAEPVPAAGWSASDAGSSEELSGSSLPATDGGGSDGSADADGVAVSTK